VFCAGKTIEQIAARVALAEEAGVVFS